MVGVEVRTRSCDNPTPSTDGQHCARKNFTFGMQEIEARNCSRNISCTGKHLLTVGSVGFIFLDEGWGCEYYGLGSTISAESIESYFLYSISIFLLIHINCRFPGETDGIYKIVVLEN